MSNEKFSKDRLIGLTDGAYAILLTFLFLPLLEHVTPLVMRESPNSTPTVTPIYEKTKIPTPPKEPILFTPFDEKTKTPTPLKEPIRFTPFSNERGTRDEPVISQEFEPKKEPQLMARAQHSELREPELPIDQKKGKKPEPVRALSSQMGESSAGSQTSKDQREKSPVPHKVGSSRMGNTIIGSLTDKDHKEESTPEPHKDQSSMVGDDVVNAVINRNQSGNFPLGASGSSRPGEVITAPLFNDDSGDHGRNLYAELIDLLIIYIGGFVVLSKYWLLHHEMFGYIKKVDIRILTLNLFALFFASLLPLTMLLLSSNMAWKELGFFGEASPDGKIFYVIFSAIVILTGLFLFRIWNYAVGKKMYIDSSINTREIKMVRINILAVPIVFFCSNILFFYANYLLGFVWVLIFFISPITNFLFPMKDSD